MFVDCNKFCLEDNTERSESNPGRSLGITNNEGRAVWKTVPSLIKSVESDKSVFVLPPSFFRTRIYRIDADASLVERVSPPDKIR